ncbi:hypothetical protein [Bosea sp. 124]|uniref:hypothetical protein n=1 Tax=Bosea sp. 124 TaxID=2135642 RepID=UPI000D38E77A|nr:hypothetical protein [Bosea sp. 124]PTM39265.1 hypothetical protein C8D03_0743 [Bosea sp. 124]
MTDDRETLLRQDGLLIGIAGASLLSGMHFSPFFDPAFIIVKFLIAPTFFISSPILLFYFTSLLVSISCLIIAGAGAAIFERITGRTRSDPVSLGVWLAGLLLLAIPVFFGMAG